MEINKSVMFLQVCYPRFCVKYQKEMTCRITLIPRMLLVLTICLSAVGCAGMVAREIPDEKRDQSGRFDGLWKGKVTGGGSIQYVGSQGLRCPKQNRNIRFSVTKGRLRGISGLPAGVNETNVSADGKFRLEIPTDGEFSGGGFLTQKPGVVVVVQGNLSDDVEKGVYVIGMEQLNNEGCSYQFNLTSTSNKLKVYSNSFKGIFAGVTTRGSAIARFGEPLKEDIPGRFSFKGDFDLTFNKKDKVNTIIIYNTTFKDKNGLKVGMSKKQVSSAISLDTIGNSAVDKKRGIIYWFNKQDKVRVIVLASELIGG